MQPLNAKPNINVPDWVQTPEPGMGYMQALTELTNPVTGETWTAPHGGYSVKTPTTTNYASPSPSDQAVADTYSQHIVDSIKYGATHGAGGVGGATGGFFRAWDNIQNPDSYLNNKLFNRNNNNGTTPANYIPTGNIWQSHLAKNKPATISQFTTQSVPSLLSTTTRNNVGQPYVYGNLDLTSSDYSIWGSKGNPYYVAGPTYTPGSGMPIVPAPIPFVPPVNNGGGDSSPIPDWTDPNSPEAQAKNYADLQSWLGRDRDITRGVTGAFGLPLLDPAVDFMYGINPFTQQSLSWYDGSTDDFNYVGTDEALEGRDYSSAVAAYTQDFMNDMTDLDQDEYVDSYMQERGWEGYNTSPQSVTPIVTVPEAPVLYGHPEVITPTEYMDSAPSGVTDTGGYEDSSTGESFSADDFSAGGNMSDWGSAEEYADDFGFDDDGWDDASSDSGGGDSGGGGSYIATAATQALGEEGLKVFEDWRDYMFKALPTFTSSFGRYRVTAPKIVAEIDKKDNSKELYKEIWDKHLKPIFDLIKEDMDNPKALSDYKIMVKELMNKYLK